LVVTANVVSGSPSLFILMMEPICSSETSFVTRTARRNNPEGGILHDDGVLMIIPIKNCGKFKTKTLTESEYVHGQVVVILVILSEHTVFVALPHCQLMTARQTKRSFFFIWLWCGV
jgi:hypothetical protein